jgi:transposase
MDISLDLHPATFTMEVVNARGQVIFEQRRETSCENLREAVGAVSGRKRVVLEESSLASWACRVLRPYVDEVVVPDPWPNHLIAKDENPDDPQAARHLVDLLWEALDQAQERRARLAREVERQARTFEPIRRFQAVPGIGWIRAATFYAIVDTPHRFATRNKLWTYCGLGLVRRASGQTSGPAHLTRRGKRQLKNVVKGAALTAIQAGNNAFAAQYERLRREGRSAEKA